MGIDPTSLATAGGIQAPATVRVTGAGEPSTEHVRCAYVLGLLSSTGAKVRSKGSSEPGLM